MSFHSFVFFFSSRRRHTRSLRDWSSDCALPILAATWRTISPQEYSPAFGVQSIRSAGIGRASCRERVEISVVAVSFRKKKRLQEEFYHEPQIFFTMSVVEGTYGTLT